MADIAAVLDSVGLAGLHAGKKVHKGPAQQGGQAGFIVALMAQMGAEGQSQGKMAGLDQLVAHLAPTDSGLDANSLSPFTTSKAAQPPASKPTFVLSTVPQQQQDKVADYSLVEGVSDDAGKEGLPGQAGAADLAADEVVQQAAVSAADVSQTQPVSGNPLAAAIQTMAGNSAKEASVSENEGEKDAPVLSRVLAGDAKSRAYDPEKPGIGPARASANAAGAGGNGGQDLPAMASDVAEGEANVLQVSSGTTASTLLQSSATTSPALPDASSVRPFEQPLRQLETRLNVSVEAHVKTPAFANEFGEKIVWLAGRQGQVAEMILNPPQLGSVEIRLTVTGGDAGAQFFSANPAVREAIEAALPKLRDLMAQAGINLGEANVRDQSFAQGKSSEGSESGVSAQFPRTETTIEGMGLGLQRSLGLGLVDLYA